MEVAIEQVEDHKKVIEYQEMIHEMMTISKEGPPVLRTIHGIILPLRGRYRGGRRKRGLPKILTMPIFGNKKDMYRNYIFLKPLVRIVTKQLP